MMRPPSRPIRANILSHEFLYIYLNKKPNEPIDPLRREFIEYIFSKDGQAQTEKSGFYPITNEVREKELKKLGLSNLAN